MSNTTEEIFVGILDSKFKPLATVLGIHDILYQPHLTVGIFSDPDNITGQDLLPHLYKAHSVLLDSKLSGQHTELLEDQADYSPFSFDITLLMQTCFSFPHSKLNFQQLKGTQICSNI